jgi:hypothetical protein
MVRQPLSLPLVLVLGVLLGSPFAWGCEVMAVPSCSTADCPMAALPGMEGCHAPSSPTGHDASGCSAEPDSGIGCCSGPAHQEPARFESATSSQESSSPLVILAERVAVPAPSRPPDSIPDALFSQRHELGRFTLHASFLL